MNLVLSPEQQEEHWRELEYVYYHLRKAGDAVNLGEACWYIDQAKSHWVNADKSWRKIVIEQKNIEVGIK